MFSTPLVRDARFSTFQTYTIRIALLPTRGGDSRFRVRGLRNAIVCHANTRVHCSVILPFRLGGRVETQK